MKKRKTLPADFNEIAKSGDSEAIKEVFDKCDINAYGGYGKGNALFFLLNDEMMRWCVEQGAEIDYVNQYGYTPLMEHAGHAFAEKQALCLIELGADIGAKGAFPQRSVLDRAVEAGSINVVKRLKEKGIDLNEKGAGDLNALERALYIARPFDIIRIAPIAEYMLENGVAVTVALKEFMTKLGKEIEFYRPDMNSEFTPQIDTALDKMYKLLDVEPVPKRVIYDGKSKIIIKQKTWQKQHSELWNLLVPGSGHASTVQGEVIRISGKLGYEILDNGCMNWDAQYRMLVTALEKYLHMGNVLDAKEYDELESIFKGIKNADEKEINRMSELSVKWVTKNTDPITLEKTEYTR